jgi:hypothetical protein
MSDFDVTIFGTEGFTGNVDSDSISVSSGTTTTASTVNQRLHQVLQLTTSGGHTFSIATADTGIRWVACKPDELIRLAFKAAATTSEGADIPASGFYVAAVSNSTVLWIKNIGGTAVATVEIQAWVV